MKSHVWSGVSLFSFHALCSEIQWSDCRSAEREREREETYTQQEQERKEVVQSLRHCPRMRSEIDSAPVVPSSSTTINFLLTPGQNGFNSMGPQSSYSDVIAFIVFALLFSDIRILSLIAFFKKNKRKKIKAKPLLLSHHQETGSTPARSCWALVLFPW